MKFHPQYVTDHEREVAEIARQHDLQMTKDYRAGVFVLSVHTGTVAGSPMFTDVYSSDDTGPILEFLTNQQS